MLPTKHTGCNLKPLAYNPQLLQFVVIDYFINRWHAAWLSARISHEGYLNGRRFPQMATPAAAEQVRTYGQLPYFLLMMSSKEKKAKQNVGPEHGGTMTLCGLASRSSAPHLLVRRP